MRDVTVAGQSSTRGYGQADLDWQIPNSPSTKFRLGSVTKQFTAASIVLLQERGKLKIDDPIKKYLPDSPAAWDSITIFNLLTHTSGIPNFTSFPDYRASEAKPTTPEQLVARFRDKPLDFAPGSASAGALYSTKNVTPTGGDTFDVTFAKGAAQFVINLAPDGKIAGEAVRPLPP